MASSASEAVASYSMQPAFASQPSKTSVLNSFSWPALRSSVRPSKPTNLADATPSLKTTTVGMTLTCNFCTKKGDLAASIFIILHSTCLGASIAKMMINHLAILKVQRW